MAGVGSVLFEVLVVLGLLVLACRWVFGSKGVRRVNPLPDYGLLSPAMRTDSRAEAVAAQQRLAVSGLRATVAPAGRGFTASGHAWPADAHVLLVFPPDLDTATAVLRATPLP